MRSLALVCLSFLFLFFASEVNGAVNSANVAALNTATTNVTTSAYVVMIASSATIISKLVFANATSSVVKIAYGPSGSETDLAAVGASSTVSIQSGVPFPLGTRFVVEAVSGTASTGYITVSLVP